MMLRSGFYTQSSRHICKKCFSQFLILGQNSSLHVLWYIIFPFQFYNKYSFTRGDPSHGKRIDFASQLLCLVEALDSSFSAQFMEDFVSGLPQICVLLFFSSYIKHMQKLPLSKNELQHMIISLMFLDYLTALDFPDISTV